MPLTKPFNVFDLVRRTWAKVEEAAPTWLGGLAGGISDLRRNEIIADGQAAVRAAGGTAEDQQTLKDELNRLVDGHNSDSVRDDPFSRFMKTAGFWIGVGLVTFLLVKVVLNKVIK